MGLTLDKLTPAGYGDVDRKTNTGETLVWFADRGEQMTTATPTSAIGGITEAGVWLGTVRALAEVRVMGEAELLGEIAASGGDLTIKSKDAEVIISAVEVDVLGDVELVDQSHLGPDELTSLRTLSGLLWRRWVELNQAAGS